MIANWKSLALLAACVLLLARTGYSQGPQGKRPNVVVILADDLGYSDIGCYGGEIKTPNLDKLAANGLRFTNFFNTARCCPSRAALMTGLYSHQAGVGHMTENTKQPGYEGQLNRRCVTIAEVLRRSGYRCYMVGKWHLSGNENMKKPNDTWPLGRGFDRYYGIIPGAANYFRPEGLTRDNTPLATPQKDFYLTDAFADNAVQYITDHAKDHKAAPFFLYTAFTAPHWPLHALKEDIERYRGKYREGWDVLRQKRHERMKTLGIVDPQWKVAASDAPAWDKVPADKRDELDLRMAIYAAQVDRMDQGIGRIVEALRRTGQLDNTLILFLADNGGCAEVIERGTGGEMGGPDSYTSYGVGWAWLSNAVLRLFKHWSHGGGVSSPCIVHWPAGIPEPQRGRLRRQPSHLIDVMATCVDVGRAEYPREFGGNKITPLEGKSLVSAFADQPIARDALYWEHEGNKAILVAPWKLVSKHPGPWELYNLDTDRTEANDLARQQPERVQELGAKWQAWAERANVLPLRPYAKKDKAKAKKTAGVDPAKVDLTKIDLTKIDRTIAKEPAYASTAPRYGLVVFGPQARSRAWVVLDGDFLHVDRNCNGDLTEAGERLSLKKHWELNLDKNKPGKWIQGDDVPVDITQPDGTKHQLKFRKTKTGVGLGARSYGGQYVGATYREDLVFAARPQDAPIVHLGGPLTLQWIDPPAAWAPGATVELVALFGTPGLGKGTFAYMIHDFKARPTALIEFPAATPGGAPTTVKLTLTAGSRPGAMFGG